MFCIVGFAMLAKFNGLSFPYISTMPMLVILAGISIGVVVADKKRFSNILEIGEIGAQVKHLSKTTPGSSYAIDRREE